MVEVPVGDEGEGTFQGLVGIEAEATEPDWDSIGTDTALELLGQLTHDQRAALIFRYIDDLAVRDVAELLGRSVSATESLLARAEGDA